MQDDHQSFEVRVQDDRQMSVALRTLVRRIAEMKILVKRDVKKSSAEAALVRLHYA